MLRMLRILGASRKRRRDTPPFAEPVELEYLVWTGEESTANLTRIVANLSECNLSAISGRGATSPNEAWVDVFAVVSGPPRRMSGTRRCLREGPPLLANGST